MAGLSHLMQLGVCLYTCPHTRFLSYRYPCLHICAHVCTSMSAQMSLHLCTRPWLSLHTSVHVSVHMLVPLFLHMSACLYVHMSAHMPARSLLKRVLKSSYGCHCDDLEITILCPDWQTLTHQSLYLVLFGGLVFYTGAFSCRARICIGHRRRHT